MVFGPIYKYMSVDKMWFIVSITLKFGLLFDFFFDILNVFNHKIWRKIVLVPIDWSYCWIMLTKFYDNMKTKSHVREFLKIIYKFVKPKINVYKVYFWLFVYVLFFNFSDTPFMTCTLKNFSLLTYNSRSVGRVTRIAC